MVEEFGYGWTYQTCQLAPLEGSSFDGTVGVIQDTIRAVSGRSNLSGVRHYYRYLTNQTDETADMKGV